MSEKPSLRDLAKESLGLFPKYMELNDRQKEKAVDLFTEHMVNADSSSPTSLKDANKFIDRLFRAARAVK